MSPMYATAVMLLMAAESSLAIPQSFGTIVSGNFGQEVGETPEEYFSGTSTAWLAGADLPGEWAALTGEEAGTGERLEGKETVFGVVASGLKTKRAKDGSLQRVMAVYTKASSGKSPTELRKALETNVGAFTGVTGVRGAEGMKFAGARLVVTLSAAKDGGVVAAMTLP